MEDKKSSCPTKKTFRRHVQLMFSCAKVWMSKMVIEMTLVFSTIPEGSKVECCLSQRSYSTSFATSMSSRVSSECCPLLCPMFQCAHSKKPLELSMMQPEATLLVSQSRHFRRGKCQQGYRTTRLQNGHWCYVIPFNEHHTWMFLDSSM